MPMVVRSMQLRRVALSAAIGSVALFLSAFLDAGPDVRRDDGAVRFDAPVTGPWCAPVDGQGGGRSCRFTTFEQCLNAALGGQLTCRPNPAAVITDEGPYRTYRSIFL
jgi:hypothetical protein